MLLRLIRFSKGEDSTLGYLYKQNSNGRSDFLGYTLEDTWRPNGIKIAGETCIPEGSYKIKFKQKNTPKTSKYREFYAWFDWHLELLNVPNFENIYIHIGNSKADTKGCILLGDGANNNTVTHGFIKKSADCFKRFYTMAKEALVKGEDIYIDIIDGQYR